MKPARTGGMGRSDKVCRWSDDVVLQVQIGVFDGKNGLDTIEVYSIHR
jgi:hypothetical protein